MRNTIFRVSLVKATPLSPLLKQTPTLGGQQVRKSIHSPRLRFKGVNVKSGEGTPECLRVRMSCSALQDLTQYLDLGSKNYNGGVQFLCISSMLYVCLQLLQCRILDLGVRAVCSLSFVVSCHPPSAGVQELWAAWCSGWCLFGVGSAGRGMWRGTYRPLGHGTSLTGEPGVEPEGDGPKDYEINSKSWIFFDLPKCMYFILMKY